MKIAELEKIGGFVDSSIVPKEIAWTHTIDGQEHTEVFTVYVERLSYGVIERALSIAPRDGESSNSAALIAAAIRLGEKADERLTYEQAYSLNPSLANLLARAVSDVNGLTDTKA